MTKYYVNKNIGSDSNNGLSTSKPFESVAKINSMSLKPGDEVLFAKGQIWKETLKPKTSGTDDNPITFGSYGSGDKKAVFDGAQELKNADWYKIGTNQWQTDVSKKGYLDPGKLYINGEAANPESANSWNVDSSGDWNWTNGKLTMYATSDPQGRDIAIQVRDEGIRLDYKDHLVFEDIVTKRFFNGITLYESADNNRFDDVSSRANTLHGFWIKASDNVVLDGIRAYDNGQATTKLTSAKTGEGVFLDSRADDTTIKNSAVYDNGQHGINISHLTGGDHKIQNVISHGNGESGVAVAGGDVSIAGSTLYDNDLGGIVATLNAKTMTLKDNVITAPAGKNLHALYARGAGDARFVSEDNHYKGDAGHVIYLHAEAGDHSTFKDDLITASKTKPYLPLVWAQGGTDHVFDDVSIVSKGWQGIPILVDPDSSVEVKNSYLYGTGHTLVTDVDGGGYRGVNNNYFKPDSSQYWIFKAGRDYSESDIDAGRVDSGSSTKPMTPSQMEDAWQDGRNPVSLNSLRITSKDALSNTTEATEVTLPGEDDPIDVTGSDDAPATDTGDGIDALTMPTDDDATPASDALLV
ncbi:right-handed parallel beta-helix repeat-containing protein [Marinivivus vitaminiproducens]|uniref:right-handed parallel beta-helix repeat-containing protein n=1 Tax=Marinivivus vitaminiproducens TaxID=3035935 RepID=UPI0027A6551F|nr:right-handed parallel beta-helix repeat-containing protein [Geminicoccaceae bacterium SCSIO 64248]